MSPISRSARSLNLSMRQVSGDLLQLVTMGIICHKRINFIMPIWASLVALQVAWITTLLSCVLVIPMNPFSKRVTTRVAVLAAVKLFGREALQNASSSASPLLSSSLTSCNWSGEK